MSTDRELLELAAKAARISGGWGEVAMIGNDAVDLTDIWFLEDPEYCAIWDPLTDDGDALRLAVKLQLDIEFIDACDTVYVSNKKADVVVTVAIGDLEIRRAIVRAAAEIGRNMP